MKGQPDPASAALKETPSVFLVNSRTIHDDFMRLLRSVPSLEPQKYVKKKVKTIMPGVPVVFMESRLFLILS